VIIFGARSKLIHSARAPEDVRCDHCGQAALAVGVFQRYFHVFFVPMFPTGKSAIVACGHCKKTTPAARAAPRLGELASKAEAAARTPKVHFIGLVVLVVLVPAAIGGGLLVERDRQQAVGAALSAPAVGDLTIVRPPGEQGYVVLRTEALLGDVLQVRRSGLQYPSTYDAHEAILRGDARNPAYFGPGALQIPRMQLYGWWQAGAIAEVDRGPP